MGRLSKFIASKVRLRFPSWKAWAFVSIALCPAFAGAERATAEAGALPLPTNVPHNIPSSLNVPHNIPSSLNVPHNLPSSLNVPHNLPSSLNLPHNLPSSVVQPTVPSRFNVSTAVQMKFNNNAVPGGAGASPNAISRPDLHHILGGNAVNGGGTPALPGGGSVSSPGGGASVPSPGGGRADAPVSRAYAPVSYGSNTVCGRYPYPACH